MKKIDLTDSNPTYTPMSTGYWGHDTNSKLLDDNVTYREA